MEAPDEVNTSTKAGVLEFRREAQKGMRRGAGQIYAHSIQDRYESSILLMLLDP
jgi:hypothetical protein